MSPQRPLLRRRLAVGLAPLLALSVAAPLAGCDGDELTPVTNVRGPDAPPLTIPQDAVVPSQSAGTLPGSLDVSPAGKPGYTIALDVPEGRGGIQPTLALRFSGSNQNGLLGVGWGLTGLSQIAPCRRTLAQDGASDAVRFRAGDEYCLDGQRLVATELAPGDDGASYRLERDTFVKVTSHGRVGGAEFTVPAYFVVNHRDGNRSIYSRRFNATQVHHGDERGVAPSTRSVVWTWALSRVEDPAGNVMEIDYDEVAHGPSGGALAYDDQYALEYYPRRFLYTSHTSGLPAKRRVELIWESRPDPIDIYSSGLHFYLGRRLRRVEMYAPAPEVTGMVWSYDIGYQTSPATGRSRLTSVQRCDVYGHCLPSTRFGWSEDTETFDYQATGISSGDDLYRKANLATADFDADGRSDVLFYDGRRQYCQCVDSACNEITYGGYAGSDECADIGTFRVLGEWQIAYSEGDALGHVEPTGLRAGWYTRAFETTVNAIGEPDEYNQPIAADFDGDGAADLLASRTGEIRSPLRGGALLQDLGSTYETLPPWWEGDVRYLGDFDGDGRVDLFTNANRPVPIISSSSGYEEISHWVGPRTWDEYEWEYHLGGESPLLSPGQPAVIKPYIKRHDYDLGGHAVDARRMTVAADFDGDGRTELAVPQPENKYASFEVSPSGAPVLDNVNLTYLWPGVPGLSPQSWFTPVYLDINGDGLRDVVATNGVVVDASGAMGLAARINTGNGYGPWYLAMPAGYQPAEEQRTWDEIHETMVDADPEVGGFTQFPGEPMSDDGIRVFDYNNDGRDDFLVPTRSGPVVYVSQGRTYVAHTPSLALAPSIKVISGAAWRFLGWSHQFGDIDGDGRQDLVQYDMTSDQLTVYRRSGERADRLLWAANGMQRTERVVYDTLTNRAIYQPGSGCEYPQRCLSGGGEVVALVQRSNAAGGNDDYEYGYTDARVDVTGRGFLGFASRTVNDVRRQRTVTEQYDEFTREHGAYPYAGLIRRTTTEIPIDDARRSVSITDHTYWLTWSAGDRVHVAQPKVVDRKQYELASGERIPGARLANRRTITTTRWDAFGNLLSSDERKGGYVDGVQVTGDRTLRLIRYKNLTDGAWVLGVPTSERVKSYIAPDRTELEVRSTNFKPDRLGRIVRIIREPNDPATRLDTRYELGVYGEVTAVVQTSSSAHPAAPAQTRRSLIEYDDELLYPSALTNAEGHRQELGIHPAFGVPVIARDPNGHVTHRQIDGFGRERHVDLGGGAEAWTDYEVGPTGPYLVRVRTSAGTDESTEYNRVGRPLVRRSRTFDGGTATTELLYDDRGNMSAATNRFASSAERTLVRYSYDGLGRVTRVVYPDETSLRRSYTADEIRSWDRRNNESYQRLDVGNRVVESGSLYTDDGATRALVTTVTYGAFDLPLSITDAEGTTRVFTYDHLGQRTSMLDPSAGTRMNVYNAFGELIAEHTPEGLASGTITTYERDRLGRVVARHSADGTDTYVWDERWIGRRNATTSADGVDTETWFDALGRTRQIATTVDGETFEVGYDYNGASQLSDIEYPEVPGRARFAVHRSYGANGQLAAITDAGTGGALWRASERDADGRATLEQSGDNLLTRRFYDPATGRLQRIRGTEIGTDILRFGYDYGYDANGNLLARNEVQVGRAESFTYDSLDRLSSWTRRLRRGDTYTTEYDYSPVGNLEQRTTTGGAEDTTELFVRDGSGAGPDAVTGYQRFDHGTVVARHDMTYDGNGRRVSGPWDRIEYSTADLPRVVLDGGSATRFGYDALDQQVVERRPGETTVRVQRLYERIVEGARVTHSFRIASDEGEVARVTYREGDAAASTEFLHRDHLGTPFAITASTGKVRSRQWHTPFGARALANGLPDRSTRASSDTPGFTSHRHDDPLGFIDMGGRVFDPLAGSFLTPDPLVATPLAPHGFNRYAYVENNPLRYTDPTGFTPRYDEASGLYYEYEPEGSDVDLAFYRPEETEAQTQGERETPAHGDDEPPPPEAEDRPERPVSQRTESLEWRVVADVPQPEDVWWAPFDVTFYERQTIAFVRIHVRHLRYADGRREVRFDPESDRDLVPVNSRLVRGLAVSGSVDNTGVVPVLSFSFTIVGQEMSGALGQSSSTAGVQTSASAGGVTVAGPRQTNGETATVTTGAGIDGVSVSGEIQIPSEPGLGPQLTRNPTLPEGTRLPIVLLFPGEDRVELRDVPIRLVGPFWTVESTQP